MADASKTGYRPANPEVMKKERPDLERAIADVCNRADLRIDRTAIDYAGGKWRLRYESALGAGANLELDLNFLLRQPLWRIVTADSRPVGSFTAKQIENAKCICLGPR